MSLDTQIRASADAVPVQPRRKVSRRHRKDAIAALVFLSPQLVGLIVFMIGPLVFALYLAFSHWDGFGAATFAGLSNFTELFENPRIQRSAINTVWFTVLQVPGVMITAFLFALFMQKAGKMTNVYRLGFVAPVVTSSVAVATIWLYLFNPEISPINSALRSVGIPAPNWLQDPAFIIPSFAVVAIWQGLGYQLVMFMAGLQSIGASYLEAAELDGCSAWQKLWHVTVPLISPTILFLSITSIIGSFQVFDYIYVFMDSSAPDEARTIVYEIVQMAFREFNFGAASALAFLLFLVLLGVTGLQMAAQKRWVHYAE
ncbi:carbohydrate ABC transporter permease [Arthrobacter cupressi]|uniref:Multiple sugar transport system permease protein n=1 Tax=Arthrobacter cupressi TaxID=1045773 RepID=A0A1G8XQK8_9MICC|nr:sugar ABC transporter permease [Arthrobacter cupressi]NYD77047.1 multiple sugar transport system permease protein [Arthrobacter cupressi]SDJ92726.1 multiple sugar transport system permease protein [Arthrobacter cupressi]